MTGDRDDDTDVWEYEPAPAPLPDDVTEARAQALAAAEEAEQAVIHAAARRPRRADRDLAAEAGRAAGAKVSRRFGLVALLVALVVPWLVSGLAYSNSVATDQVAQATAQRLDALNATLESQGREPVAPTVTGDPAATIAAAVLAEVLTRLPDAPSAEQVAQELQTVVAANVLGPTLGQASAMVAAYLRDNPAPPGRPPSQAEIDAAVARQYAADPPADGQDGADGDDGQDGTDGQDGRSVLTGPEPVRLDDDTCVWRTTYSAEPAVQEYPAGDAACPDNDSNQPGIFAPATYVMAPLFSLIGGAR